MESVVEELSGLARRVLDDHRRAPTRPFYDAFALGNFFDLRELGRLDEAYAVLTKHGLVLPVEGGFVTLGGETRPMFRLASNGGTNGR